MGPYHQDETNQYDENYHPNYILDDNPNTTWTIKANQQNKSIQIPLTPLSSANSITLKMRNGNQNSKLSFTANGSVKTAKINFLNNRKEVKKSIELEFQQEYGWQEQHGELPNQMAFQYIELDVTSGYKGKESNLISISDVQFLIDSDVPYNESAQKRNQKRLLEWTQAKEEQAKISKDHNLKNPFASNQYKRQGPESIPLQEAQQQMASYKQRMKKLRASKSWYTRDFTASLSYGPSGIFTQIHLTCLQS